VLRRIDAPHRRVKPAREMEETVEEDLLSEPDERVRPAPTPLDPAPRPKAPRSDAELFGDDPEALFEIYMDSVDPSAAELFRGLGPDFRLGYLALSQGAGERAVELFERVDWSRCDDPRARLERPTRALAERRGGPGRAGRDRLARGGRSEHRIRRGRGGRESGSSSSRRCIHPASDLE
jgi:hypothetical protein